MKRLLLLTALLSVSVPAFATDLKCRGRAEPSAFRQDNMFGNNLNYELTNGKDGFVLRDFNDSDSSSSASSSEKPLREWEEGGLKVIGMPGVFRVYIHDRHHALLAETRGGYDMPEYTQYVELICD